MSLLWHSWLTGPTVQGRMVEDEEVQSNQLHHRYDTTFRLTQPQTEQQARRQSGLDRLSEQRGWPPRVVRFGADQDDSASGVIHRVRLPS